MLRSSNTRMKNVRWGHTEQSTRNRNKHSQTRSHVSRFAHTHRREVMMRFCLHTQVAKTNLFDWYNSTLYTSPNDEQASYKRLTEYPINSQYLEFVDRLEFITIHAQSYLRGLSAANLTRGLAFRYLIKQHEFATEPQFDTIDVASGQCHFTIDAMHIFGIAAGPTIAEKCVNNNITERVRETKAYNANMQIYISVSR